MVPLETLGVGQVDAVEDHLELADCELDPGRGGLVGEVRTPAFESPAPQAQAVATPVQHLQSVGGAIAKNEQVAGERIGRKPRSDEFVKPVESEPHIDGLCGEPEFDGGREAQHDASRASAKSVRSERASAGTRMTIPLGKATSIGSDTERC